MNSPLPGRPADGYDAPDIADLVARKTRALLGRRVTDVIPGEAFLPTLLAAACSGDRVLDFGGGAGLHYLAASQAFPDRAFKWAIVEHPLMLGHSKSFENASLRFFSSPDEAVHWLGTIDLLHSNGALQYLDEPEVTLQKLLDLHPRVVLWARIFLGDTRIIERQIAPLSAHGPGPAPADIVERDVTHNVVRMDQTRFLEMHAGFRLAWRSSDSFLYIDKTTTARS